MRSFEIVDVAFQELERFPDALDVIRGGDAYSALVIRDVFPPSVMAAVVERLERRETRLIGRPSPYYEGQQFGRILPREEGDLADYFQESAQFPEASRALFAGLGAGDYLARLTQVTRTIAGGRPVELARNAGGALYQAYSIRQMLPGGSIDLHYENESFDAPSMNELVAALDRPHQMSAYLTLQAPEAGGELSVYPLRGSDPEARDLMHLERKSERTYARIEALAPRVPLLAGAGDMLLFDAGRHFHRVTEVLGSRARWTMGSFLSLAKGGREYLIYS